MNRLALAAAFSLISLTSPAALACRLSPDSEWNWPKEKLVQNTKQIAIAKLKQETETDLPNHGKQATFVFEVQKMLKGPKDLKKISVTARRSAPGPMRITRGTDCELEANFEHGKSYLIFVASAHMDGYQEVSGPNDPWVKEAELLVIKNK
jgi:hypothetical protein